MLSLMNLMINRLGGIEMRQIESVQNAIDYIEGNLNEINDLSKVAQVVNAIYLDLQQGFVSLIGFSLSEYVRNRKLYEAAKDLITNKMKVMDVATKYGYDSSEGFSRAFLKFHGVLPSKIVLKPGKVKVFKPITVNIQVEGGFAK